MDMFHWCGKDVGWLSEECFSAVARVGLDLELGHIYLEVKETIEIMEYNGEAHEITTDAGIWLITHREQSSMEGPAMWEGKDLGYTSIEPSRDTIWLDWNTACLKSPTVKVVDAANIDDDYCMAKMEEAAAKDINEEAFMKELKAMTDD